MAKPENDALIHEQPLCSKIQKEPGDYEDEINLIDYLRGLLKHKYFILLATLLPTILAGIILFFLPREYTITYSYDVDNWNLNGKSYEVLLNRFYSEENLTRLIVALQKNGLEKYAGQLNNDKQSRKFIRYTAIPPFLDLSRLNISDPDQLNKIKNLKAFLLDVTISDRYPEYLYKVSSVIRDNIENVILLYVVREQLSAVIRDYNNKIASIEHDRFDMELALKNTTKVLMELKKVNTSAFETKQEGVVLQFNVGEQNQYLPLSYQIQATESKRILLVENITTSEEKDMYYKDLLDLNNKIFTELDTKLISGYTAKEFKSFLIQLAGSNEKPQLKDYLNFYTRQIENTIMNNKPITEKPKIVSVGRETIKKTWVVLVVCLMLSVFAAFLMEGLKRNNARLSS
jgi:hypothetical protein